MIKEETIEQTKFFKGEDKQFYLVSNVQDVKLVTLISCENGSEAKLLLGDDVCSQFTPVEASFNTIKRKRKTAQTPPTSTPASWKKSKRVKRKKDKSSQFKGVKKSKKPYADGRDRFEVSYYDPVKKKAIYLGCSDNEYLAAAKYEEHVGNKDEARRLRGLVEEYKALNPDKPAPPKRKRKVWKCKNCGIEYRTKATSCITCRGDIEVITK